MPTVKIKPRAVAESGVSVSSRYQPGELCSVKLPDGGSLTGNVRVVSIDMHGNATVRRDGLPSYYDRVVPSSCLYAPTTPDKRRPQDGAA